MQRKPSKNKPQLTPQQRKEMMRRWGVKRVAAKILGLYIILLLVCGFIVAKVVYMQFGPKGEKYREISTSNAFEIKRIAAHRGNILSDDGRILVTSIPIYKIRMDFGAPGMTDDIFMEHSAKLCESLAQMFGDKTPQEYLAMFHTFRSKKTRYAKILPRRINHVELQAMKQFPLINLGTSRSGFIAEREYSRVKPFDEIASRTIGFVSTKGEKIIKVGIEGGFDDKLRGTEGLNVRQKISGNFWVDVQSDINMESIDGRDVRTTINIEMQDIVQTALREQLIALEADWGTVVVMEVETGYVKAIANISKTRDGSIFEDYNYAVGRRQEPGSTFKLPVLLDLLDKTDITLNTRFDTERGVVEFGEARITDTRAGGYGVISMDKIFYNSSNIGMVKAVNSVYENRPTDFVDNMKKMGFGRELDLQITGEPRPMIKDPRIRSTDWDGTSLTMMSHGYAVSVTPLQTLAFFNAVANDGVLLRPLFVDAVLQKGRVVQHFAPQIINPRIAKPEAVKAVQRALENVVQYGTAQNLKSKNYRVAAKTGTAQVAQGRSGYLTSDGSRHYLGSVAGYFPADKPKYSMIVALKTYREKGSDRLFYGGALAAPLFKTIADEIFSTSLSFVEPYEGSARGGAPAPRGPVKQRVECPTKPTGAAPRVVGMDYTSAMRTLENRGFRVRSRGYGRVVEQTVLPDSVGGNGVVMIELHP